MIILGVVLICVSTGASEGDQAVKDPLSMLPLVLLELVLVMITIGLAALCLLLQVLKPTTVRDLSAGAARAPGKSLLYGVATSLMVLFALVLLKGLPNQGLASLIGLVVLVPYAILVLVGTAGIAHAVGEAALTGAHSRLQTSDAWAVLTGSMILGLATLVPIAGWIALLLAVAAGLGAYVRKGLTRRSQPDDATPMTAGED